MGFELVTKLEDKVASFFGAPYAVATDSVSYTHLTLPTLLLV